MSWLAELYIKTPEQKHWNKTPSAYSIKQDKSLAISAIDFYRVDMVNINDEYKIIIKKVADGK